VTQRWRMHQSPLAEIACNENNANYLERYRFPMPEAEKPDFWRALFACPGFFRRRQGGQRLIHRITAG
jgi:hypothetical protein